MTTDTTAVLENSTAGSSSYTDKDIKHLRNAAHIRQAPGMYIGDTGTKGLHHLVYELIYNSVDEALAGFCKHITVTVHVDGSIGVADDGRGIPVDRTETPAARPWKWSSPRWAPAASSAAGAYSVSAGLHGIGAKAVTALAEWTEARVRRNGRVYMQEYERGNATSELKEIGAAADRKTGTTITFKPDPEIFHDATFDFDTLEDRSARVGLPQQGPGHQVDRRTDRQEGVVPLRGRHRRIRRLHESE